MDFPLGVRAAFEFRHRSWHSDEVFGLLRSRNLALCITDGVAAAGKPQTGTPEKNGDATPLVLTADYTYLRLRDEGYTPEELSGWAGVVRGMGMSVRDAHVYFKHEEAGKGPEFAALFLKSLEEKG